MNDLSQSRTASTYCFPYRYFAIFSALIIGLFCVFDYVKASRVHDERWHVDTVLEFSSMLAGEKLFSLDYDNSLGPVVYLIYGAWAFIYPHLQFIRILSILLCILTMYVTIFWLKVASSEIKFFLMAACSGPWFFLSAFLVHGEQITMCCVVLTLIGIFSNENTDKQDSIAWNKVYWSLVAASLIPISKIYSVFTMIAIFLYFLFSEKKNYKLLGLLLLTGIPSLLVWWYWKGLTPPAFRNGAWGQGGLKLSFQPIWLMRPIQMLANCGFYFAPFLFSKPSLLKHLSIKASGLHLVGGMAIAAAVPLAMAGPLDSLFMKLCRLKPTVPYTTACERVLWLQLFYGIGMAISLSLIQILVQNKAYTCRPLIRLSILAILIYGCMLPFTGTLFVERYMYPVYLFVFLLGWSLTQGQQRSAWPFIPFIIMGIVHAFSK